MFPQKPFQLLLIQAIRDLAEVYEAKWARGQNPHSPRISIHLS